jgi:hypothetical protein
MVDVWIEGEGAGEEGGEDVEGIEVEVKALRKAARGMSTSVGAGVEPEARRVMIPERATGAQQREEVET